MITKRHAMLALILGVAASFATPAAATLPSLQVSDATCTEGQPCTFVVKLIGTHSSTPSTATFQLIAGTAKAGIDYLAASGSLTLSQAAPSAKVIVQSIDNSIVDGSRGFTLKILRGQNDRCYDCTALGTIKDNDVAPAPPSAPPSAGPFTAWVAAPLTVGGYACNRLQENTTNIGPCGTNIVYRITGALPSADAVPVQQYTAVFFQDLSLNFPLTDSYALNFVGYFAPTDLKGIAPANVAQWAPASLIEGGYARAKVTTPGFPKGLNPTANSFNYVDVYRSANAGEIFRIYNGGRGYSWDNRVTFSLKSVTGGDTVILYADDLEGVKP